MISNDIPIQTNKNTISNNLDNLFTELKRIEQIILLQAKRLGFSNNFPGIDNCPDSNNSVVNNEPIVFTNFQQTTDTPDIEIKNTISSELRIIIKPYNETQSADRMLPLYRLQSLFSLSDIDINIVLFCLLPLLNRKYEKLYSYLQNDITKNIPSVNLIVKLLSIDSEDIITIKQAFSPDSLLVKNNIIQITGEYNHHTQTEKYVHIDEHIVEYLTGANSIDVRIQSFSRFYYPSVTFDDLLLSDEIKERLILFINREDQRSPVFNLFGVPGSGRHTTAEAICHAIDTPLLYVDVKQMLNVDYSTELLINLVFREGKLLDTAIYLDETDLLFNDKLPDKSTTNTGYILSQLDDYSFPLFISSERQLDLGRYFSNRLFVNLEFDVPEFSIRKELWQRLTINGLPFADDIDFDSLANKFRFTAGQILDAVSMAESIAIWRDPESGLISGDDLYLACRQRSRKKLVNLTHHINSQYDWDDIILPKDQKEQLFEICNQVRYRNLVYNDWGFGNKLKRGSGLNILFSGPSGTGKTMAAEIMGNELNIDVYKVDLSTIVSKYVGETEKNLDCIFNEGETANAIVFFDEADALFGKRSETRDSHDRYANIEISYLLQKMEEYDGIIILSTNLRKNMDEAFTRRMHFVIEFPMPEEQDRLRIWKRIYPENAPLANDVDLAFLSHQFSVSGGNIRNIALTSAFLAAQDSDIISMKNIIRATKREYQKIGKLCTEADFAQYYNLVKG